MRTDTSDTTRAPRSTLFAIAGVLTLAVLLVGSVRFARYDWTGIPFERTPMRTERVVSEDCTERIRPYTTDTGRVIAPVTVDEQQYLSLVDHFRGEEREDLHVDCQLDPFVSRPALPWVASLLPFDEGVSLGLVNLVMVLVATWSTLAALAAQGRTGRQIAVVGACFAIGWNTLWFGSAILLDAGVVALVAVCWWLLARGSPWWVWPVLLVSYPVKETVAVVVLPVMAAAAWAQRRDLPPLRRWGPLAAAAAASVLSVVATRTLGVASEATWDLAPDPAAVLNNLLSPVGLVALVVATGPLFVPALLVLRGRIRERGWVSQLSDPAAVGVATTVALCAWVTLAADLSPRFAWVGFPFAATLAAQWWSRGRPAQWLAALPAPAWLDRGPVG